MLNEKQILKLISDGENSYIEFKLDKIDNKKLAIEMIAFSNHKGGTIFLGVDDNAEIIGLTRDDNENRIMNICTDIIKPRIIPSYYEISIKDKKIGIIEIENGYNKPYFMEKQNTMVYYLRYGTQSKQIKERDELQRLFQASQNIHYEIIPVSNANIDNLDMGKIKDYLLSYRNIELTEENQLRLLENLEIITLIENKLKPTIAGLLLFGKNDAISRYLPQAGIMCVRIRGDKITDEKINHKFLQDDIFTNFKDAIHFFYLYNTHSFTIENITRKNLLDYPESAFRELLTNALIHRDYTISGNQIAIWIYDDRIEIRSPGALPNTITIERMKMGIKYHRNPLLAQYFYSANLMEGMGQGIPKVDKWLKENGNAELEIQEIEKEIIFTMYKRKE